LDGRCAIVTGGGTGIGAALAMGLARAGAAVALIGRRPEPLEACRTEILNALLREAGSEAPPSEGNDRLHRRVVAYPTDVTDLERVSQMLKDVEELTGGIPPTILVNNAGVNFRQPADDLTSEHFHRSFDLMLTAPFMLSRAMSRNFQSQGYGRIINLASLQSYRAFPDSVPYAAAKSGVMGLTRAIAEAYSPAHGDDNVTCNGIAPGFVRTELTAQVFDDPRRADALASSTVLGRNSEPDDLVGTAVYLSSPASSYVTGQIIPVDGGFTALGHR